MLRQQSQPLFLISFLFFALSLVCAKNVTVFMNDVRPGLLFSTGNLKSGTVWTYENTGLCADQGGITRTSSPGGWVWFQFNGTAIYVDFAEYELAGLTTVTIDSVKTTTDALGKLGLSSQGCTIRTLYATNLTNTNHTLLVEYGGMGLPGQTVINKFIYDDGSETPRADPNATRAPVTIKDTGPFGLHPSDPAPSRG
ncbi:hypothetical protein FRB90_005657, partial [Tulasnella sp. 427]